MESLHLFPTILLCFLCSLCFQPTITFSDIAADRAALIRLSTAVRGNTLRWNLSDPSPCSWTGVTCDNSINRVTILRLPGDRLSGEIPLNSVGNLTRLRILSLRGNLLSGVIPPDLGSCTELQSLYLQNNRLTGEIPATLFGLSNLLRVDISGNNFSGEISPNFNNLTRLRNLYIQNNQFTGSIPDLNTPLLQFNVSFNRLTGRIPSRLADFPADSFAGNIQLCGSPLNSCPDEGESNKLSAGAIAGIALGSVFGSILIISIIILFCINYTNKRNSRGVGVQPLESSIPPSPEKPPVYDYRSSDVILKSESTGSGYGHSGRAGGNDDLVFLGEGGFLLDDLLRASAEVLGKGSVGTTYKAYLDHGVQVIVKRLKNVCVSEREFTEKIVCFGELYHENLLPIRGYYYGKEEKLLIFDFMPMGSLSSYLHGNKGSSSPLTWEIRSTMAYQIANGLKHLHSHKLSHGNIKSHNILLTHNYGASISESGLTQLVSSPDPTRTGYPEVNDVYGFGILILELLTGKDPMDTDLPKWVGSVAEEKGIADVLDPNLFKYPYIEEQIFRLLRLGIHCASTDPDRRPSMTAVVRQIKKICKF